MGGKRQTGTAARSNADAEPTSKKLKSGFTQALKTNRTAQIPAKKATTNTALTMQAVRDSCLDQVPSLRSDTVCFAGSCSEQVCALHAAFVAVSESHTVVS